MSQGLAIEIVWLLLRSEVHLALSSGGGLSEGAAGSLLQLRQPVGGVIRVLSTRSQSVVADVLVLGVLGKVHLIFLSELFR